jgi:hypothetical protein
MDLDLPPTLCYPDARQNAGILPIDPPSLTMQLGLGQTDTHTATAPGPIVELQQFE